MRRTRMIAIAACMPLIGASQVLAIGQEDEGTKTKLSLRDGDEIELRAFWEPVGEWAMAVSPVDTNETLLNVEPAFDRRSYGARDFSPFLPDEDVQVGAVWEVERDAVLRFLTQFHEGALSSLHHAPVAIPGSWACLRARNDRYAEVLTRSHAQFELEGEIMFTPGQFEGRMLIDLKDQRLVGYRLQVPSRKTNLDVNVPTEETRRDGHNLGLPGIGWIPRMELVGPEGPAGIEWSELISDREARKRLRDQYYGAIDWLPFEEAVELAEETGDLLHVVVILGTLDDESC